MIMFRIGDYVGAQELEDNAQPVFGRIYEVKYGYVRFKLVFEYMIKTAEGEITGPWRDSLVWPDISAHVDYPHHPGMLYDCPACEAIMKDKEGDHDEFDH
jgi:hypothetical protein